MGSWAEGCCISNLEIDQGTPIVVGFITKRRFEDLNSGAFGVHTMVTPLLRGEYDDYGGMDIKDTEENKALFLTVWNKLLLKDDPEADPLTEFQNDNIRAAYGHEEAPKGLIMWMARQDAFDMLRTVRHEYSYENTKTVGASEEKTILTMLEGLKDIEALKRTLSIWDDEELGKILDEKADEGRSASPTEMKIHYLNAAMGRTDETIPAVRQLLLMIIAHLDDATAVERYVRAIAEIQMLRNGLGELRKALLPLFRTGPQYDGWLAVEDYAKFLNKKVRERKVERVKAKAVTKENERKFELGKAAYLALHGRKPESQAEYNEAWKLIPQE